MANLRNNTNDLKFVMLSYGIVVYAKYLQSISCKITHVNLKGNTDGEKNTSDEEEVSSRNSPITGGHLSISQEYCSTIIKMKEATERLLTVFYDTEAVLQNSTNRLCIGSFASFPSNGAEESPDDNEINAYVLFRNAPALIAYQNS